jgi:hypothetical protein
MHPKISIPVAASRANVTTTVRSNWIRQGAQLSADETEKFGLAPHFRFPTACTPYAFQYNVGMEHQIHKTVTITAAYRGQVQIKSFRSVDVNAPILPTNPELTADYPRPNSNFGQIQQIESGGRTLLNALDLSFRGRAGR